MDNRFDNAKSVLRLTMTYPRDPLNYFLLAVAIVANSITAVELEAIATEVAAELDAFERLIYLND